jgi:hypothetical protein
MILLQFALSRFLIRRLSLFLRRKYVRKALFRFAIACATSSDHQGTIFRRRDEDVTGIAVFAAESMVSVRKVIPCSGEWN